VQQFLDKLSDQPPAPQDNEICVDELYASAQTKAMNNDRQTAIQLLEQVLVKEPEHPLAHNDLGVLYYEYGDMEKAKTHYEQASRLQLENEIFQKNLADFYWIALADPGKAMQQYVQVLKLNPKDVESLLSCVQICMALNKTEDAREFLDIALSIEPWNDHVMQMQKQLENGIQTVGTINAPNDLYEQAKAKSASGDLEGAIDDLTQVLVHLPDESKYHNELGVLYYVVGEKEKALASYEKAVRLEPSEPNYAKNLADFYLVEQGRAEDAMKLYLQVLEKNPEDIEALMAIGVVCANIGHGEDAKHFYNRILEIEPSNQGAQEALENLQKQTGREEKQPENQAAAG
jgi:Flp pilus assembly protein TadD